jgi:hypothetical protein
MGTYTRVKRSHIVPVGYLKGWAADDRLMMRLVGEAQSVPVSPKNAGVRAAFYRRERPNGAAIDDIEWSLSVLESNTLPLLPNVRDAWPLDDEDKSKLAFLFGYQLVRGPRWRAWYEQGTRQFIDQNVRTQPMRPGSGLETEAEIQAFEKVFLGSTRWATRMLSVGTKAAGLLGSMQWSLIEFRTDLLATSDRPVVPWPLSKRSQPPQVVPFDNGLFETLEFRVPISPRLAVLMTWRDGHNTARVIPGSRDMAANLNAFTIAQAERQWFHSPERVPPIGSGQLLPLSPTMFRGYAPHAVQTSQARAAIQRAVTELAEEDFPREIPMVVWRSG